MAHLPANVQGTLWLLVAGVLLTAMATLAKVVGQSGIHAFEIAFFRSLIGLVIILPFAFKAGLATFKTKRPVLHTLRIFSSSGVVMCTFYAVVHLPIADAMTLAFSRALFIPVLAVLVLREVVGGRRIGAVAVGFVGVLIMLRPTGTIEPAAMVAVLGAALGAVTITLVKLLSRTESTTTLLLYYGFGSTILTAIPAALNWVTPDPAQLALLCVMGAVAVTGQSCFIRAFAVGEASALAPVDYVRLIFAAGAGYLVFAEVPDGLSILGALIIVLSSLYLTYQENRATKAKD